MAVTPHQLTNDKALKDFHCKNLNGSLGGGKKGEIRRGQLSITLYGCGHQVTLPWLLQQVTLTPVQCNVSWLWRGSEQGLPAPRGQAECWHFQLTRVWRTFRHSCKSWILNYSNSSEKVQEIVDVVSPINTSFRPKINCFIWLWESQCWPSIHDCDKGSYIHNSKRLAPLSILHW